MSMIKIQKSFIHYELKWFLLIITMYTTIPYSKTKFSNVKIKKKKCIYTTTVNVIKSVGLFYL